MIDISKLTKKDIGRWVLYKSSIGKNELGKLKSWSRNLIFVVYGCAGNWNDYQSYTAAATYPKDLRFCDAVEKPTKLEVLYAGRDYDSSVKEVNGIEDE